MNLLSKIKDTFKLAPTNNPKPYIRKEIGTTGVQIYSGMIAGEEYLYELRSLQSRLENYDKMKRSDAQIKAVILAITLPIRQANWYIDPASDSPEDIEIAKKIQDNLFEGMTITWDDYLRQSLSFLWMGFSIFEKVIEFKDGLFQYRKLAPRLQKTLHKWHRDNHGGLKGIQQCAQGDDGKMEYYDIDIEKLVIFINDQDGSNFEGTSILRSAFKHWKLKNILYEVDTIGHDRWASGIPVVTEPENPNATDTERVEVILENLHSREKSWVLLPHGYEMNLFEKQGQNTGVLKSIQHHDEAIAKNVLAQFISLGTTATGSRSLGESFEEMFMLSLNAVAGYVADVNNKYVIPQLVDYNWQVKKYPKLKFGNINLKIYKWIESLTGVKTAGVITTDLKVENHVRDLMGLPEKSEEEFEEEKKRKEEVVQNIQKNIKDKDDKENQKQFSMSDKEFSRKMTNAEKTFADIELISYTLDEGIEKWETQVQRIRTQQIAEVSNQIVRKSPDKIIVPFVGKMADRLFSEMKKLYQKGKSHVAEEIERQEKEIKKLSSKPALLSNKTDFEKEDEVMIFLKDKSKADAVRLSNSLTNSGLFALYNINTVGKNQNEIIAEIEKHLKDSGVKDISKIGTGSILAAYGMGREVEAKILSDKIQYAVYSAILDSRACNDCLPKDGVEHDIKDEEFRTPNPTCYGGGLCRCVNIYALKGMEGDFQTKSKTAYYEDARRIKSGNLDYEKMRARYEV